MYIYMHHTCIYMYMYVFVTYLQSYTCSVVIVKYRDMEYSMSSIQCG